MSATIDFYVGGGKNIQSVVENGKPSGASSGPSSSRPAPILPAAIMMQLQGRRVTVMLSLQHQELEGVLVQLDEERGDLFLEDVTHFIWKSGSDANRPPHHQENKTNSVSAPVTEKQQSEPLEEFVLCSGGGSRREWRRYKAVMVNSKYIELITPTVFTPER